MVAPRHFALAVTALLAAAPALANTVVTFGTFASTATGTNFRWVRSANTVAGNNARNVNFYTTATANGTAAGATNVAFFFKDLGGFSAALSAGIPARFLMQGTVTNTAATTASGTITQTSLTGSFSIIANAPVTYGDVTGTNLLSGSFSQVKLTGTAGGSTGAINGSTTGGANITYSSDFLTFLPGSDFDLGYSLTSISPLFATAANQAVRSYRAVITGNFSSNPAPIAPSIPEPGTWAMLIAGLGLVGFARRRRQPAVAA